LGSIVFDKHTSGAVSSAKPAHSARSTSLPLRTASVLVEVDHHGGQQHDGAATAVVRVRLELKLRLHHPVGDVGVQVADARAHARDRVGIEPEP
jgi:hypothetical protein